MTVQRGNGSYIPSSSFDDFTFECFDFKPSLLEDILKADLIIGHAGAATILESLENQKLLIVVPNEMLMHNHQIQLARQLAEMKYLSFFLVEQLDNFFLAHDVDLPRKAFPSCPSPAFRNYLYQELNIA